MNLNKKKESTPKEEDDISQIGLPELKKVTQKDWEEIEQHGITMDYNTVMYPMGSGDLLERIYINIDSHVFLNHRKKWKNEEQILLAEKRYVTAVYFHSLFLYMITKKKNYSLTLGEDQQDITIDEYIRDVFDSYYSDFLLNFGMDQLMGSLED